MGNVMKVNRPDTGKSWKIMLAALVGLFLVAMVVSLVLAGRRVSRVVDTDYYRNGLHYGQTLNRPGKAAAGWTMAAVLAGDQLQVHVLDKSGVPVTGGRLRFAPEQGTARQQSPDLIFAESGPGMYQALSPVGKRSEIRGAMHFSRGADVISEKMVLFN